MERWSNLFSHEPMGERAVEKNHLYKLLNISTDATQEEIEEAYRCRQPGFDFLNPTVDFEGNPRAQELYKAYLVLSDAEKRKEYDETERTRIRTMAELSEDAAHSVPPGTRQGLRIQHMREHPVATILIFIIFLLLDRC